MSTLPILYSNPEQDYEIIRKIGKGSSGIVYLAKAKIDDKFFAIKRIQINSEQTKALMINEIAMTKESQNPNVVTYYDSYFYQESFWLVVELMQGNLTDLISDLPGNIPEKQMAYILHQVLIGLRSLHRRHRIHRDIKSDNVLISLDGCVKLSDFGYAAQLTLEDDSRTTLVGTPS